MSSKTKYNIYIAVHKGDPIDFSKYRHTRLCFVPEDGSLHDCYHVTGFTKEFTFERRRGFDPRASKSFATMVTVGRTTGSLTASGLNSQMESVHVANEDPEFNCQQWVDFALKRLYHAGYLTAEQYDKGLDGMVLATMEAEDE